MLRLMGAEAEIEVKETDERINITLSGSDMGMLIGHHGETLDALQYITGLALNHGGDSFTRVSINTEGYREKREESLKKLAKRTADRAVKYNRNITLEPMPASERRVIHTALSDIPGVSTFSTGQEPRRRVVIAVAGAKNRPDGNGQKRPANGGSRGNNRRYNNNFRPRNGQNGKAPQSSQNTAQAE